MAKRSDSSKALREDLKQLHVDNHVPDVDNKINIAKYFEHAALSYKSALNSYEKRDWTYSYVQFKIFLSFCVKLRKHTAFKTSPDIKAKNWIVTAIDAAFIMLEYVIIELDKIEDQNIVNSREIRGRNDERTEEDILNDEFDCLIDEFDGPTLSTGGILLSNEVVSPVGPSPSVPISMTTPDSSTKTESCGRLAPERGVLMNNDVEDYAKPEIPTKLIDLSSYKEMTIESNTAENHVSSDPMTGSSLAIPPLILNRRSTSEVRYREQELAELGGPTSALSNHSTAEDRANERLSLKRALEVLSMAEVDQYVPTPLKGNEPNQYPTHIFNSPAACSGTQYDEERVLLALTLSAVKAGTYEIPTPHRAELRLNFVCGVQNIYLKDDFFVSFSSFMPFLPSQFQISRSVIETNRCFFIHLGVATGFHPFLLQGYFRNAAAKMLKIIPSDDVRVELLQSVMQYAGFVDANVLCLLWPREFSERGYRICFLCGSLRNPMFISFIPSDSRVLEHQDIVICCDGSHFTLLYLQRNGIINHFAGQQRSLCSLDQNRTKGLIEQLLFHSKESRFIIQEHSVRAAGSIGDFIKDLE